MKGFKCDGFCYCAKCYLDILNETEYEALCIQVTRIVDVDNNKKCDNCKKLMSRQESLNCFKHIMKIIEESLK